MAHRGELEKQTSSANLQRQVFNSATSDQEKISKILFELKNKNEDSRDSAAIALGKYLNFQARNQSAEIYARIINDLTNQIFELVNNNAPHVQMGGVLAIEALLENERNAGTTAETTLVQMSNYLRVCFRSPDEKVLLAAAVALGKLVKYFESVMPTDALKTHLESFLEALDGKRAQDRKLVGALFGLRELALHSKTLFLTQIQSFFERIWFTLRDRDPRLRLVSGECLAAALQVIVERDNRTKYHRKIWEELMRGIDTSNEHSTHGSLIALGEMLIYAKDFMVDRNREACEQLLRWKESKSVPLKRSVIILLPRLAAFQPEFFAHNFLAAAVSYLLDVIKQKDQFRSIAFISAGEIAQAVGGFVYKFSRQLGQLLEVIKDALPHPSKSKGGVFCEEAITCACMLSQAYGHLIRTAMAEIIPLMFNGGLTELLAESLTKLAAVFPKFLPIIQQSLLEEISRALTGLSWKEATKPAGQGAAHQHSKSTPNPDFMKVALALRILGNFDFSAHHLGGFIREHVVPFLDDTHSVIRREAVFTLAKVIAKLASVETFRSYNSAVVGEVLEKVLIQGVSDPDASVRRVLGSLDRRYDSYLADADNLRYLFIALNDEQFQIREMAIAVIGRMAIRNPSFVMPSLRRTITQLLGGLEFSGDDLTREESARLLADLIRSAQKVIKPYGSTVLAALLPKLKHSSPSVNSAVLVATGELAAVAGDQLKPHLPELMPMIIERLQDGNNEKREIAVRALGQLTEATGFVITPYSQYPNLLPILLHMVQNEATPSIRHELLRVLGILGALDPYRHKLNSKQLELKSVVAAKSSDVSNNPQVMPGTVAPDEEYSSVVAITALMRILGDPALITHYPMAIQSVVLILKGLGSVRSVPLLRYIMPPYLNVIKTADHTFCATLFEQLVQIVAIVKAQIAPYVSELFEHAKKYLGSEFWNTLTGVFRHLMDLIEEISVALAEDFTAYLPVLMPLLLKIMHSSEPAAIVRALSAFEMFGTTCNLEDYLHLAVPAMVALVETSAVRHQTLRTLTRLCAKLNFSDYASRVVHPLVRLLDVPEARFDTIEALCGLCFQLGSDFAVFIPIVSKAMSTHNIVHSTYEGLITALLKNQPMTYEYPKSNEDSRRKLTSMNPEDSEELKKVNVQNLQNAWDTNQRVNKDDWLEWIRRLTIELLTESPSRSLKACSMLAQAYPPLARELFYAGFFSIWTSLNETFRALFVSSIEKALNSSRVTPDIQQILLNLAEFMEHDDKALPIDIALLGKIAERCQADAKALHYKEMEFMIQQEPSTIEPLIEIYTRLQLSEAAQGLVVYSQEKLGIELKESWFEKLQRWEDALASYNKRGGPDVLEGKLRCMLALAEWDSLVALAEESWPPKEVPNEEREQDSATVGEGGMLDSLREERLQRERLRSMIAPYAAEASYNLGRWNFMETCVNAIEPNTHHGSFYRAVMAVQQRSFEEAQKHIDRARTLLDTELVSRINESYDRAYSTLLSVQRLSELEEVIAYIKSADDISKKNTIRLLWSERMKGLQANVEVWRSILAIRTLAIPPSEDSDTWLQFARLCAKSGNLRLSRSTIVKLLAGSPNAAESSVIRGNQIILSAANTAATVAMEQHHDASSTTTSLGTTRGAAAVAARAAPSSSSLPPWVVFAFYKQIWREGDRQNAFEQLKKFATSHAATSDPLLLSRVNLALGHWLTALTERLDDRVISQLLGHFQLATKNDSTYYKACHAWALGNFEAISHYEKSGRADKIVAHLEPAVKGFFRSIALGPDRSLQDVLRLLTLWFRHGSHKDVQAALSEGFATVSIDTWLKVIPQIIARINLSVKAVRSSIADLLHDLGKEHPQALVSPLTVASKSTSESRKTAAQNLLKRMQQHSARLIEETLMVSQELIRVSVLWSEQWHVALEEASRLYFSEAQNYEAMFDVLAPLHATLEAGPVTQNEAAFARLYGRDLAEALEWSKRFAKSRRKSDLSQAWDLYYHVFKSITKQLPTVKSMHLRYVSPKLLDARNLELAVPGSYQANEPLISIKQFHPVLQVIASKQRPRKLGMTGSDLRDHTFLLKGHEDTRQDERVMQLFSLVNNLFAHDPATSKSHLSIRLYSVTPLSPNSGLIGWVPNHDTLNALVIDYRDSRHIPKGIEAKMMSEFMPGYDLLSLIQKVEVFEHGMTATPGNDLQRVLWLKSRNSEVWLEKRLTYTRSLAVMCMVGYILGLGDRHPSNIMLERNTGKILHIDFGDCFEVAMLRDKFPEKVPFRLTRMLVNAMEVSGIEGNFRITCERVMQVLRENKESLMAVLEAFVYDPLINWKLLGAGAPKGNAAANTTGEVSQSKRATTALAVVAEAEDDENGDASPSRLGAAPARLNDVPADTEDGDGFAEVLNEKALSVVDRISKKLTGRDFSNSTLSVTEQVDKLIVQATSVENLAQAYMGWMPLW